MQAASGPAPLPAAPLPNGPAPVDKWQLLRDLATARAALGLSDRDLTVLQALLSFQPGALLDPAAPLVVHPSNTAICERANGMACSTMRRHLARLVAAGLVTRRDSPNGKRYVRRLAGEKIAFGFDLRPLPARAAEFADLAEAAREDEARLRQMRDSVSLLRRDLATLAALGLAEQPGVGLWDAFSDLAHLTARDLRRRLGFEDLALLHARLRAAVDRAVALLDLATAEMSSCPARNEQHQQNSEEEISESESVEAVESRAAEPRVSPASSRRQEDAEKQSTGRAPAPPLRLVLECCPEIAAYSGGPIHDWPGLLAAAERLRPMTGISASAWEEAKTAMGPAQAAVALAAMLERFREIRNPGGYLRHLSRRADQGAFSATRMVAALSGRMAA